MKKFIVGIKHEWALHRGCRGVQTEYEIVYAATRAKAMAIAARACVEEDFQSGWESEHWATYTILFCESVTKAKLKAIRNGRFNSPDWEPLAEICAAIDYNPCYAPDGRWFVTQSDCKIVYGITIPY